MSRNKIGPIGGQASTKESEIRERAIVKCIQAVFTDADPIVTDETRTADERLAMAMRALLFVNEVITYICNDNLDYTDLVTGVPKPSKEAHADVIDLLDRLGRKGDSTIH